MEGKAESFIMLCKITNSSLWIPKSMTRYLVYVTLRNNEIPQIIMQFYRSLKQRLYLNIEGKLQTKYSLYYLQNL